MSLGGSPGEVGGSCGSLGVGGWGQQHWWQRPQRILIGVSAPRGHHFAIRTWPYRHQAPVLERLRSNNQQEGNIDPDISRQGN